MQKKPPIARASSPTAKAKPTEPVGKKRGAYAIFSGFLDPEIGKDALMKLGAKSSSPSTGSRGPERIKPFEQVLAEFTDNVVSATREMPRTRA
ncbi:hypothetical protein KKE92_02290 [Candidatus Micrarchaeota archaeon]|nr:hypothetical protein [Candidatus Micrarchaeota archaeon]MBU1681879.1 hypothetical protein [Candidatus Micrarchaeota archaeon]